MKSLSEISIAKWMEIIIRGDLFCMDGKCRIPLWKTQNCKTIFLSVWWILYSSSMHILLPFLRCIFSPTLKCNIMRQAYLEKKVKCYYRIKSAELTGYSLYSFIHRYTEMLPLSNRTSWCWLRTLWQWKNYFHWLLLDMRVVWCQDCTREGAPSRICDSWTLPAVF